MRHLRTRRSLGVKPAHRHSMLRNLVTSLVEHGQIRTTLTRARTLRKPLDRMITLGKRGDLTARRAALGFIKSKAAMASLFGELAERYRDRPGGYSRILRLAPRRGDGAEMALVMLVGGESDPFGEATKPRRRGARKPKQVLEQVAEEVRGEEAPTPRSRRRGSKAAGKAGAAQGAAGGSKTNQEGKE